jgi:dimethylamine/trimethylamine dehydrogenase
MQIRPRMLASMREVKAEGGWGVICTEYNFGLPVI